eukprot:TRINITY_DN17879_c0_g1_i1.p1 TRINITY_DN17879_c0_g1~~TRINITY_DN17879_c0_g1_i1.p1  ORF type:complete len:182 (+),score=37.58 TRINITY_DN17879_c0_g1_i1:35-580(+)
MLPQCQMSHTHISRILDTLTMTFKGDTYHPIHRNCNSFSEQFVHGLLNSPLAQPPPKQPQPPQSTPPTLPGQAAAPQPPSPPSPNPPFVVQFPKWVNRPANYGKALLSVVPENLLWSTVIGVYSAVKSGDKEAIAEISELTDGMGFKIGKKASTSPIDPNSPPDEQRKYITKQFMMMWELN